MPRRYLPQIQPIVRHGLMELQAGSPPQHALTEVALMAALVGAGTPAEQAIRHVEQMEPQWGSMGQWERAEPYHTPGMRPSWGGKTMPQQQPWGAQWPHGMGQWGMGQWGMQQQPRNDWGH